MKNLLLVFVFLFSVSVTAQESYPYKRPELLFNKTVTVKKNNFEGNLGKYEGFYSEKSMGSPYKNEIFLDKEVMEGRKFRVTEVEPYVSYEKGKAWIKLEELNTGEVIYFNYHLGHNYLSYYFDVEGGLDLPADFYCDYVEVTQTSSSRSFSHEQAVGYIKMIKAVNIATGKESYKLQINSNDARTPKKKTGLVINFEGGKSISLPGQIYNTKPGKYFTELDLTPAQIELFKSQKVTGYRIMDLDHEMLPSWGMKLQGIFNCLLSKS